jgi:hypothetical protein
MPEWTVCFRSFASSISNPACIRWPPASSRRFDGLRLNRARGCALLLPVLTGDRYPSMTSALTHDTAATAIGSILLESARSPQQSTPTRRFARGSGPVCTMAGQAHDLTSQPVARLQRTSRRAVSWRDRCGSREQAAR